MRTNPASIHWTKMFESTRWTKISKPHITSRKCVLLTYKEAEILKHKIDRMLETIELFNKIIDNGNPVHYWILGIPCTCTNITELS